MPTISIPATPHAIHDCVACTRAGTDAVVAYQKALALAPGQPQLLADYCGRTCIGK
ncbi:hypothetical protein WKW80_31975 [Variovorax humicola]|uniref:Uncharacterized protein n=1 Tax=Variovorax humicola TaxID=1769758 RepID=A0ABU8W986_9BURK